MNRLWIALLSLACCVGCEPAPPPPADHVQQPVYAAPSEAASKVYDEANIRDLIGDGQSIIINGERRYFSRQTPPKDEQQRRMAAFREKISCIPRSEWSARIKQQTALRARVSDYCTFPAYDQRSTNYCWANGPCQAFTIVRNQMGLPFREISAASVAGPITNYRNVGGWELDAIEYLTEAGGTTVQAWPNAAISRAFNTTLVGEDRENYIALEWVELETFDEFATAMLQGFPCVAAYDWWRHVVTLCDLVEISPGRYGVRFRNSWSDQWGDKNELGYGGFGVLAEGKGTPSSGFMLRQVRPSARPVVTVSNAMLATYKAEHKETQEERNARIYKGADGYSRFIEDDGREMIHVGGTWYDISTLKFQNGRWYYCNGVGCRKLSVLRPETHYELCSNYTLAA